MTSVFPLILIPAIAGVLCFLCVKGFSKLAPWLFVGATGANLVVAGIALKAMDFKAPAPEAFAFGGFGLTLDFRIDALAGFILVCAAGLAFLLSLYAAQFMNGKKEASPFFGFYLLTIALLQGAVAADHLLTLLFFWEGMLGTMFGMIVLGGLHSYKTAVKAFFINGVTDLCMMAGFGLILWHRGTMSISAIALGPIETFGVMGLAFVLVLTGAVSKAGAMPFHSWIPDAASDAPLPFMALMPGAMEKLIGIYFVARVSLDLFAVRVGSWPSILMMTIGAVTLLLAVLMALIQKDFKRLLSFHAISQVGYMILGIGTGTAFGIVGGLFHMVNNALYKSTLFLTGGAVERQAGTTDLKKIGGLGKSMPITWLCFLVAALSISGVPFTNGFYSKELIYHGAWEISPWWYAVAAVGSFFTAASFLKLGHAAFKGTFNAPESAGAIKDPPAAMLVPMVLIALACIVFGLGNPWVVAPLILPAVSGHVHETEELFGLLPHGFGWGLTAISVVTLGLALVNHLWGAKRYGSGLKAVDHIHYAPVAHQLYDAAEKRWFDPYENALKVIQGIAWVGYGCDRAIDYVYNKIVTGIANAFSLALRAQHNGSHTTYLAWSVAGAVLVLVYFVGGF